MDDANTPGERGNDPDDRGEPAHNTTLALTNPHYLAHLTQAGAVRDVRATADINTTSGLKLVARGTRITLRHFERLVGHRLSHQIDHMVGVADGVAAEQLASAAKILAEQEPFDRLVANRAARKRALDALARVQCLPVMAGKLAIMKERLLAQFDHLVRVALCAAVIADDLRFTLQDCIRAATAGAFHDLGYLHIDPAIFEASGRLSAEHRRQIHAHPLIGHLILS